MDNACIIGVDDGTRWSGGLCVNEEEGIAISAGFDSDTELRERGIMVAGEKYIFLQSDEEVMLGFNGSYGVCIHRTIRCCVIATTHWEEGVRATFGNTNHEVGKVAVRMFTDIAAFAEAC